MCIRDRVNTKIYIKGEELQILPSSAFAKEIERNAALETLHGLNLTWPTARDMQQFDPRVIEQMNLPVLMKKIQMALGLDENADFLSEADVKKKMDAKLEALEQQQGAIPNETG